MKENRESWVFRDDDSESDYFESVFADDDRDEDVQFVRKMRPEKVMMREKEDERMTEY
jgi:hypothetical protein